MLMLMEIWGLLSNFVFRVNIFINTGWSLWVWLIQLLSVTGIMKRMVPEAGEDWRKGWEQGWGQSVA